MINKRAGRRAVGKPTAPKRSGRPVTHDGDTERRILDGAHAVFMRHGTAGARMQEIAREAGVNSALLHYYFRSKERLADAVFQRAATQLLPNLVRILVSDADLEVKVAQVVELELTRLSETPYLPGYVISELTHHPQRIQQLFASVIGMAPADVGALVRERLSAQIDERVRAGRMQPIAAEQFVVNLLALCIFPFAARPMLMALLGLDEAGFAAFIDRRRAELAPFFLRALEP
ncbi:MAG TPA: TetR/AcrR family transcriptional regulator [Vicinamibacterales bacterium]|jgi:AcrR family transcriptional regulator|nr:TetR/AcrR family transcriptional regulator [Vicinamibacterales bacterium]